MSHALDPEDDAALAVLDKLGRVHGPEETSVPEPEDEVEEVLRRLYHETIGILAYALEPAAVDPGSRARLLAAVAHDETQEVDEAELAREPADAGSPPLTAAPVRPPERAFEPLLPPASDLPGRAAGRAPRRGRGGWALAAAALLAVAGLGLFAAFLQSELNASRARLARIERDLVAEATASRAALADLRGRFERMTAPATTIYPLRCPTGHGPAARARVYLYVSPDGRRWELAAHDLGAEPEGRDYQVWFLVGEQPLSGGCFNVRDGKPVVSVALAPPANATGAAVSIEPRGGSPRPTGEVVLVAQHAVRL